MTSYTLKFLNFSLSILILTYTLPGFTQSKFPSKDNSLSDEIVFQDSLEPPGEPEPKDTKGSGSRDPKKCSMQEQGIKPLMPPERNYGLTLQKLPSIFVRLPKTKAKRVMLSIQDTAGKYYQRAFLPITEHGIVSFNLPEDKPSLTIGKNYKWSLVIVCGDTVQPDDPTFMGWVQRVEKTSQIDKELIGKSAVEKAKWYGKKGYWYDMLREIQRAKKTQPDDLKLSADLQESWQ
ncbi:protein of unknown function (DUF928) [Rivularia sp. PCC 7116]|uniref:DUF928 domain-containing protein n=1 Tax=Rivularia sp. PCC 7116 TaxID=373994 RepID=UPI00029EFAA2|nr:DUF928 domain-containing protein [Rivularia sp. PCC 7116]AFY58692.1 protein of unknown function (DUF928) [Rivularia sp. PCC 7116]